MSKIDYGVDFGKYDVYPSYMESDRLEYIPLHKSSITVKEFYDRLCKISAETTQYITFIEPHNQIIESKRYMEKCKKEFETGKIATYCIIDKEKDEFIGLTTLKINWNRNIILSGIFLFKEYWGNGYSTERGELILNIAFREYGIDKYVCRCATNNEASINSINKYVVGNGGKKWGTLPNRQFRDDIKNSFVYAISKEQYFRNK